MSIEEIVAKAEAGELGETEEFEDTKETEEVRETAEETSEEKKTTEEVGFDTSKLPQELQGKSAEEISHLFNQMRTYGQGLMAQVQQMQQQDQQQEVEVPSFGAEDFIDDPGGFNQKLEQFFQAKATPLVAQLQQSLAATAYQGALRQYPLLQEYEDQVYALAQHATPEQLANPQTWATINAQIMSNNQDEIIRKRMEATKKPKPESTARAGNLSETRRGRKTAKTLSAAEKAVADAMGVSYEDYAKFSQE